jgi:hypothetical protein
MAWHKTLNPFRGSRPDLQLLSVFSVVKSLHDSIWKDKEWTLPYRKVKRCSGLSNFWKNFPFSVQTRASFLERFLKSNDSLWRWMRKDLILSLHKKIRISPSTIFLQDITVTQPVKRFSHIDETRKIITVYTKNPATSHYAESDQSTPRPHFLRA